MRKLGKALIAATFSSPRCPSPSASAQSSRQIKFIVPFPAGGGGDVLTRMVAEKWAQMHGIATVIENRPGAATVLGVEAASRAAPDGNTLGHRRQFLHHPSELQEAELRPADQLRAGLPAGQFAAGHRRQQRVALQDAHRMARCRPRQARRAVPRQRRPREPAAHRLRAAQAPGQGEHHVRAVQRQHAGAERAARRPRRQRHVELFGGRRACRCRQAARACRGERKASRRMAERADGRRAGLQGLCGRGLVRTWSRRPRRRRTRSPSCRNGAPRRCWRRSSSRNGTCRASRRSAARPKNSPRTCAQQSDDYARVIREANIKGE